MKNWTTKQAKFAVEWARQSPEGRVTLAELAAQFGRTPAAVQEFLRRLLPPGERPWQEKPRWSRPEIDAALEGGGKPPGRSASAVRKFVARHAASTDQMHSDDDRPSLTVTQVAADLGRSRATIYRLIRTGALRRFKGGIAETSFADLLRDRPEVVPYSQLPRDHREWLVLNGYHDPVLQVKVPSVRGLLE
jgi:hypothetical protein